MGPNYEDELSPEQMAAIQRERNRALYDQAQMQQMAAMAGAHEAYPMRPGPLVGGIGPAEIPRPADYDPPQGAGSPSPHAGAVADAHDDAAQMGHGNHAHRPPRHHMNSKPQPVPLQPHLTRK